MASIDNQDLFEQYYQKEYDFNTTTLTNDEVREIKRLVHEKRVDYGQAPIGERIFEWILAQERELRFEFVDFDSDKIDGMLFIPTTGKERAYILLNSNKPLVNQIFAAGHEYYHYICDYARIKHEPYICDFSMLKDVNEKKASRFAAEFLLPEDALRNEVERVKSMRGIINDDDYVVLSVMLTVKYQIPLKAVIYRLHEEGYIDNIEEYLKSYPVIKEFLKGISIESEQIQRLYDNKNPYKNSNGLLYREMNNAYEAGLATREEILRDAAALGLDRNIIEGFFDLIEEDDDVDDIILDIVKEKWRNE